MPWQKTEVVSDVIAEVPLKGGKEKIVVSLIHTRNGMKADFRLWWIAEDREWYPSKKGFNLNSCDMEAFIEAVNTADGVMRG